MLYVSKMTHNVDSDSYWVLCLCHSGSEDVIYFQITDVSFRKASLQFCKPTCSAHFTLIIADPPARFTVYWLRRNSIGSHTGIHQVHDLSLLVFVSECNHVFLTASGASLAMRPTEWPLNVSSALARQCRGITDTVVFLTNSCQETRHGKHIALFVVKARHPRQEYFFMRWTILC